jgi:hypothetical protein
MDGAEAVVIAMDGDVADTTDGISWDIDAASIAGASLAQHRRRLRALVFKPVLQ